MRLLSSLLFFALTSTCFGEPRIGAILPLSGDLAQFGEKVRLGIEMGSTSTIVQFEDSKGTKDGALAAFHKLASYNDIRFFIGPFGPDQSFVIAPEAKKRDAVLLAVSLCDARFRSISNMVCLYPSVRDQVQPIIDYFDSRYRERVNSIAMVIEDVEAAEEARQLLTAWSSRRGIEVLADISFDKLTTDFRSQFARLRKKTPDILIVGGSSPLAVIGALRQAAQVGIKSRFRWFLSEHDSRIFEEHRDTLEGAFTTGTPQLAPTFVEAFTTQHRYAPDLYHAVGFDAARALTQALQSVATTSSAKEVIETIVQQSVASTATRGFKFTADRAVSMDLPPSVIIGGTVQPAT